MGGYLKEPEWGRSHLVTRECQPCLGPGPARGGTKARKSDVCFQLKTLLSSCPDIRIFLQIPDISPSLLAHVWWSTDSPCTDSMCLFHSSFDHLFLCIPFLLVNFPCWRLPPAGNLGRKHLPLAWPASLAFSLFYQGRGFHVNYSFDCPFTVSRQGLWDRRPGPSNSIH